MVSHGSIINQDVFKEDDHKCLKIGSKYMIHSGLDRRGCIRQTKLHNKKFIIAFMCPKYRFVNVSRVDPNLMVSSSNLLKTVALPNSSKSSATVGIENLSGIVTAFRAR